jgi:hypothetical protein
MFEKFFFMKTILKTKKGKPDWEYFVYVYNENRKVSQISWDYPFNTENKS